VRPVALRAFVACGILAPALISACGSEPAPKTENEVGTPASVSSGTLVLSLDFDDLGALEEATGLGSGYLPVNNDTSQPVTVRVATVADGKLEAEPGRAGGYAVRFPTTSKGDPRRAVLTVTTTASSGDPLGPGVADFTFGADFVLDKTAEAHRADNGNNLVQRGLFSDDAQYKLQVDRRRASCRVAGDKGEVVARSVEEIVPGTWYRVTCSRTGDRVVLKLDSFAGTPQRSVAAGPTGNLSMPGDTPLVVGGKATAGGDAVAEDSDQFNGAIDNVFLSVDDDT
jgi:hypothetical protein